jgi:hypothetical protein
MKRYSQFHDGYFEGLWIDGTTVHVYLSTLEKERFIAVAEGTVALAAGGFRLGNLVFDVVTRDRDEIVLRDIEELYSLQDGPAGEAQGDRLLSKARQEGMTLLETTSSYGATCMVLANSVGLLKRNEWLARYLRGTVW